MLMIGMRVISSEIILSDRGREVSQVFIILLDLGVREFRWAKFEYSFNVIYYGRKSYICFY
jgi:hypothetical protein